MRRKFFVLILIILYSCWCLYLRSGTEQSETPGRWKKLRHALLRTWLRHEHYFLSARHDNIEITGRWPSHPSTTGLYIASPGATLSLTLHNTTSFFVDLGCNKRETHKPINSRSASTTPDFTEHGAAKQDGRDHGFALLEVDIDDVPMVFTDNTCNILHVSRDLSVEKDYEVKITVILSEADRSLHLQGFWLSKGGVVSSKTILSTDLEQMPEGREQRATISSTEAPSTESKLIIEVMRPTVKYPLNQVQSSSQKAYPEFLRNNNLFRANVATINVPQNLTLMRTTSQKQNTYPTIPDLYFRSSIIHNQPTPHRHTLTSNQTRSKAIILELGLTDIQHFFNDPTPSTNHRSLETFKTKLTNAYVQFILTIRRTAWQRQTPNQDMTFAYNSAPSDIPIFILGSMLPDTTDPALKINLDTVLYRTVTQLRRIEGDQYTVLVDTAGWLEDGDFTAATKDSSSTISSLNARGQCKIAHFLLPHLCPYLSTTPTECPFDKHTEYLGNHYSPDEVAIGRVLQEKKIEKIKSLVGGF